MSDLLFKESTFKIIGACMNVANELGCGFLEAVYQEALGLELTELKIPFEPQKRINIYYKKIKLEKEYIADFVCYDTVILEIKAIQKITAIEEAQVLNYLRASDFPLGLIVNFGTAKLEWKRFANTREKPRIAQIGADKDDDIGVNSRASAVKEKEGKK